MVNSKYALALSLGLQGYYKYNRIKNILIIIIIIIIIIINNNKIFI